MNKGIRLILPLIVMQLLLFIITVDSDAQITRTWANSTDTVDVMLNRNGLENAFYPFDIAFNFVGPIPPGCSRITASYDIAADYQKKHLNKNINFKKNTLTEWKLQGHSNGRFTIPCPGMDPNVKYTFTFTIYSKPVTDDKAKEALRVKFAARLTLFGKEFATKTYTDADLNKLNDDLNSILTNEFTGACNEFQLVDCKGNAFTLNVRTAGKIFEQFKLFNKNAQDYVDFSRNLHEGGAIRDLIAFFTAHKTQIGKELDFLLSGKINPSSKDALDISWDASFKDYPGYKLKDGIAVLKKMVAHDELLTNIVTGSARINGTEIVSSDTFHLGSVQLLYSLVNFIGQHQWMDSAVAPDPVAHIIQLERYIQPVKTNASAMMIADWNTRYLTSIFPDLAVDFFIAESLKSQVITSPDVSTDKTPYISADGGIGYASAAQAGFSYFGANFYFSPVNKKAPISSYNFWYALKKMVCVNIGVANFFSPRAKNSYSILGETASQDLLLGLGIRLGRIPKLNFGLDTL